MWIYEKKLPFPVRIKNTDLDTAQRLALLYSGSDSELSAAISYLTQRFSVSDKRCRALLNDIGTEELSHFEMLGAMISQLIRNAPADDVRRSGLEAFFIGGDVLGQEMPRPHAIIRCTGDALNDMHRNLAAEQHAIGAYARVIAASDDPDVQQCARFLKARELVHFQRVGECISILNGLFDANPSCRIDMRERALSGVPLDAELWREP